MHASAPSSESARVVRIMKAIRYGERRLRERFGWLKYQDALGFSIFIVCAAGMLTTSWLYIIGLVPAWACVVLNALFTSLLHEIEHDLIHEIYFKGRRVLEGFVFWTVWALRGNAVNPYYRRKIHLLHHRESGRRGDIEERMITNGMKWGLLRFWSIFDQRVAGILLTPGVAREARSFNAWAMRLATMPFFILFYLTLDVFILYHVGVFALEFFMGPPAVPPWLTQVMAVVNVLMVVWVLPNIIRQSSIVFISSNMHYYGDIDGKLFKQTQVLNKWYFWPIQMFCFNFGSTHGIHHFVVNQPFYLRQMAAPWAHRAMRKYGVRFNDLGTFRRANRFHETTPASVA